MLQRVGISITDNDLKHIQLLQKRFGVRSRSELFRELVKRYEQLEKQVNALSQCVEGYLKQPEATGRVSQVLLHDALKNEPYEAW